MVRVYSSPLREAGKCTLPGKGRGNRVVTIALPLPHGPGKEVNLPSTCPCVLALVRALSLHGKPTQVTPKANGEGIAKVLLDWNWPQKVSRTRIVTVSVDHSEAEVSSPWTCFFYPSVCAPLIFLPI